MQRGLYPDVTVILGQPEFPKNGKRTVILNPTIIFEVLSKSTKKFDDTQKFYSYKAISSLQEYILVDQEQCFIEIRRKSSLDNQAWTFEKFTDMEDDILLQSIDFKLSMKDIYRQIVF